MLDEKLTTRFFNLHNIGVVVHIYAFRHRGVKKRKNSNFINFVNKKFISRQLKPHIYSILSSYMRSRRVALRIRSHKTGKPFSKAVGMRNFHFNISHTHGLSALAVCNYPVGLDVEHINSSSVQVPIFSKLAVLDGEITDPLIALKTWTRIEAIGKAHGTGLVQVEEFSQSMGGTEVIEFSLADDYWMSVAFLK